MFDLNTFGFNKAIVISLSSFLLPAAIATVTPTVATKALTTQLLARAQSKVIEPEILAEINRARTDPQAYADWLEEQKQYYEGALLRLPGETTIRTNRGFKALQEAIAFLRQQQPLPPLTSSEALAATAKTQLETISNFPTANNISINNISYGMVTPQAIVMQLIVDDRFPDRRRRRSLFATQLEQTGIVCQSDERYGNMCAIAYQPETGAIAAETSPDAVPEIVETASNNQTLPQPTQPRNSEETTTDNSQNTSLPTGETIPPSNSEAGVETAVPPVATVPSLDETDRNTEDSASDRVPPEVTATQNYSQLLEKVERGTLEAGDNTIPDDGSFYDSYPLEGQAGDSFVISLESDEFDTFVAVLDAEGNILEQNDDISDDNSNSRLRVTLPDNGIYSVIVNAYDKGGTGSYVLTISR
ncbi:pre-peptidase C-terminal domain-containing protein [Myxosarcina sp. GI1(2024)]